jgi:hypothetical protein
MAGNLEEKKIMSADGQSSVEAPVAPEGGAAKHSPTGIDVKKKVDPKADKVTDGVTKVTHNPEKVVEEAEDDAFDVNSIFEGMDLSEDFKSKATLVFEAAVNEAASQKAASLVEQIESDLQEQFETSLSESLDEIVENLDGYLDYVVKEWMEENKVAIESGIKVEMAESLMSGLKELFYEHNVEIDEETIDVVAGLEEELETLKATANRAINERLALEEELQSLRAAQIFETMTEGLSTGQVERLRILSEKVDNSDLETYADNLKTLKESFFKTTSTVTVMTEDLDREGEALIVEETAPRRISQYDSVNAYAAALKSLK